MRRAIVLVAVLAGGRAQAAPRGNPFACLGEGESLARGNSTAEIEAEIATRLANPPADEGPFETARHHCVTAELMRRVGDARAAEQYRQAIAAAPGEPGFELWYGHYLRNVRGPRAPLLEQAEVHYHAALDELRALRASGAWQPFDEITESWVRRGLIDLYQQDGLPLLGSKAYPYPRNGAGAVGVALTAMLRVSRDTSESGAVDDARRFAAEASFAAGPQRLKRPLDEEELRGIVRTPWRHDVYTRLRLRLGALGAVDVSYQLFRAPDSQISAFTEPNVFNDVKVDTVAIGWRRAFDLYPAFDALVDVGYRRVSRVGVVEWYSELREDLDLFEAHPAVSRFLGPDKLTLGMNYVYMQIPTIPGGKLEDRVRARAIRAFYADYAVYRQLLLPDRDTFELRRTATRGLHLYAGHALDDEAFGVRVVYRRDTYGGVSLRGIGRFDVTAQGTLFTSDTVEEARAPNNAIVHGLDVSQSIRQVRATLIGLYRIIDDEAIPDVPTNPLAGLNLVVPIRADFATRGIDAYDNVRGGAELWVKLIATGLRGTTFLVTAGYEAQWFHRLHELVHIGRLELRMGWGTL